MSQSGTARGDERMNLVADTNVVVAAILRKGDTRKIVFSKNHCLHSPDRVHDEILKHSEEFMEKACFGREEFLEAIALTFENITTVPIEEYSNFKESAIKAAPKGHEDDWPFIALAMKLNCPLWTNDTALKSQGKVSIITTQELIKIGR